MARERTEAQTRIRRSVFSGLGSMKSPEAKANGAHTLERQKPVTFQEFVPKEYMPAQAPPVRRNPPTTGTRFSTGM